MSSEYVGKHEGERKRQVECAGGRGEPVASPLLKRKRTAQSACILSQNAHGGHRA